MVPLVGSDDADHVVDSRESEKCRRRRDVKIDPREKERGDFVLRT